MDEHHDEINMEPVELIGFLSLPPEVRNQIYEYLFLNVKLGISTIHTNGPSCSKTFCTCTFPIALTATCRLIREETLHLLLAATTLEVTNRVEKSTLLPDRYLSTIPRAVLLNAKAFGGGSVSSGVNSGSKSGKGQFSAGLPFEKLVSLEVLELRNVSIWCRYYDEAYLESQVADECMFNLAMFNLRRISPSLIDLCNTKERKFQVLLGCQFVGNSTRHETVTAIIDVDSRKVLHKARGATVRDRNEWSGFY